MNAGMNKSVNKVATVLSILAVTLCAGCNGNNAQTTTTTAALSLIADDDTSEDEVLLDDDEEYDLEYGDWEVEEIGEVIENVSGVDMESGETVAENDDDTAVPDKSAQLTAKLRNKGQLIYGDKNFQIYYYGDTTDDNGSLVSVFGYRCFHGGLVRITGLGMHLGTVVNADGVTMYISPRNTLTDGYICISSDHGDDAYYDKPEEKWWTDNEYIYMRYLKDFAVSDPEKYAENIEKKDGFCTPEEFTEMFGSYGENIGGYENVIPICLDELSVQQARLTDDQKWVFDEPSDENTCKVSINYSVNVIRVPFDTDKTGDEQ